MKELSILIGSGFSVPDGVPSVGDINDRISHLKVEDIYIHSDMRLLLNKGVKRAPSVHWSDEVFMVELIQFYREKSDGKFDYERFYDYITSFQRFEKHSEELLPFFDKFRTEILKSDSPFDGIHSYVSRLGEYFTQLVATLLQSKRYYEDVGLGNYPPYDEFFYFLKSLVDDNYIIHVHSLNHDLLFEYLASRLSGMAGHFTDAYSDLGSEYYGEVRLAESITKQYLVRLKRFTNRFDRPLRLYKLHGSVDNYIANVASPNPDLTRVKRDWGVGEILKEVRTDGIPEYSRMHQHGFPDMLSGASSKAIWYDQPYYKELFGHFRLNLNNSDTLLVLGYGFGDDGINHLLEAEYLRKGNKMHVVDIREPDSRLVRDYNSEIVVDSVANVTTGVWLNMID